jgi:hypothetical protein
MTTEYYIECVYNKMLHNSSTDGHTGYFPFGSTYVHMCVECVCMYT